MKSQMESQNESHIELENEQSWPKPGLTMSAPPAPRRPPGPALGPAARANGNFRTSARRHRGLHGAGCGWHQGPLGPKPCSAEHLESPRTGPRHRAPRGGRGHRRSQCPPAQGDAAPGSCWAPRRRLGLVRSPVPQRACGAVAPPRRCPHGLTALGGAPGLPDVSEEGVPLPVLQGVLVLLGIAALLR